MRIEEKGRDRYRLTLGTVHAGGIDINALLVRSGAAWVYRRYSDDPALKRAERMVRAERRGL